MSLGNTSGIAGFLDAVGRLDARDPNVIGAIAKMFGLTWEEASEPPPLPEKPEEIEPPPPPKPDLRPPLPKPIARPEPPRSSPVSTRARRIHQMTDSRDEIPSWLRNARPLERQTESRPPSEAPPLFPTDKARGILIAGLSTSSPTGEISLPRIIEKIARSEVIRELPRRDRPSLARGLRLLVDESPNMLPFRRDVERLRDSIVDLVGRDSCEVIHYTGSPLEALSAARPTSPSLAGLNTVCLTDLSIGRPPGRPRRVPAGDWERLARMVRRSDGEAIAIVPYERSRWPTRLRGMMRILHWDPRTDAALAGRRGLEPELLEAARDPAEDARALSRLAACAVRVEPALLRALRLELLPELDAGVEGDVFFGRVAQFQGPEGFVFDSETAAELRKELLLEDASLYDRAFREVQALHAHLPPVLQMEEELTYLKTIVDSHPSADRRESAHREMRTILRRVVASTLLAGQSGLLHWAARALPRLPGLLGGPDAQGTASRLEEAEILEASAEIGLNRTPPRNARDGAGALPSWASLATSHTLPRRALTVQLHTNEIVFELAKSTSTLPLIELPDTRPLIVELSDASGTQRVTLDLEGAAQTVSGVTPPLRLKSLLGDVYEIDSAEQPITPFGRIIDYSEERERRRGFLGELPFDPFSLPDGQWTWLSGDSTTGSTSILWRCIQLLEERGEKVIYHFAHRAMPEWDDFRRAADSLATQIEKHFPGASGQETDSQQRLLGNIARFLAQRGERDRLFVIIGNPGNSNWVLPELLPLLGPESLPSGLVGLADLRQGGSGQLASESGNRIDLLGPEATSIREQTIAQRFELDLLLSWLENKTQKEPAERGLPLDLLHKHLPEVQPHLSRLASSDWWRASFLLDWLKAWVLNASERSYLPDLPPSPDHDELVKWYLACDWLEDVGGAQALAGVRALAAAREALPQNWVTQEFPFLLDRCLPFLTALNDRLTLRTGVRDVLCS